MSATPTPWTYEVHELSTGFSAIVYDGRGFGVADHLSEERAALIVKAVNAAALLDRAIEFSAYSAVDPLTIRLDFASADDRIAAADALDELFSALARGETA